MEENDIACRDMLKSRLSNDEENTLTLRTLIECMRLIVDLILVVLLQRRVKDCLDKLPMMVTVVLCSPSQRREAEPFVRSREWWQGKRASSES